ncbi:YbaK/EbsC family protein [Sphaerisporangium corydalis]|uniref:YbaK/EbsC family protein n=1 Tax=Sphaerisporangium corydalis TaxID=1441875 RepID=A0ABV9ECT5_9ACTN|nr:YbaK/EbsC family protein [Sphaerisporangium corydalis]
MHVLLLATDASGEGSEPDGTDAWGPPRQVRVLWPVAGRPEGPEIPERLRAELREAKDCLRAGAHSSAVVMVRRLLEGVCADHGVTAAPLSQALKVLSRRGLIEGRLLVWAEDLRLIGNEAAHIRAGRIPAEDARDAVVLAEALLDYLYVFTPKYRDFRKRREAAGTRFPVPARERLPDTLSIRTLRRSKVRFSTHSYSHDPSRARSRRSIADELGVGHDRLLKAVVAYVDGHVVLAVAPVGGPVDLAALAAAFGGRVARVAPAAEVSLLGTDVVSPLGVPLRVPAVADASVLRHRTVYVASGRHGLELELEPAALVRVIGARVAPIAPPPGPPPS